MGTGEEVNPLGNLGLGSRCITDSQKKRETKAKKN